MTWLVNCSSSSEKLKHSINNDSPESKLKDAASTDSEQQTTGEHAATQGHQDQYTSVSRDLVKAAQNAGNGIVNAAQGVAMGAPAPARSNTGLVGGTPFAAGDSGGIAAGYTRSYGDKSATCVVYGSENWLSAHGEYTWRAEQRNEHRLAGFIGTDGLSYGQFNASHAVYHTGTGIGGRWGGQIFMAPCKATEDITHTLPAKKLPSGTRLLSTTHSRWRFNWSGMLGAAALTFLRIFFRRERRRPIEVVWKHLESDRKAIAEQTCAGKNAPWASLTALWRGFSKPSEPHLRDCLEKLQDGESVSYTSTQESLVTLGAGVFASAGRQTSRLDRGTIEVARIGEDIVVTMTRVTGQGKSRFGVLPGGLMTGSGKNKPGVETWTYTFDAEPQQNEAYQKLIHSVFDANSGRVQPKKFGQEGKGHLQSHTCTHDSVQSHSETGIHVLQPRWLAKRWLPNHSVLGLSKQNSKVAYTTETDTTGSSVKQVVRTTERRKRAIRGSEGVRQEILTTRLIRPDQANLAGAHLLLRVKHKYSHATPQTVERDVMKRLSCLLGAEVGTLVAPKTPAMPSRHAIALTMDLRVEHLVALAGHRSRHIAAVPDETLRKELEECIDGWPKPVQSDPGPAFNSLRDLVERTADRSTEDATLLLGCLNHLMGKVGPSYALQLRHKAALYLEPERLVHQLEGQYAREPMWLNLRGVRARFSEVRQALERIDYAHQQLLADSTLSDDARQQYEAKFGASKKALNALLYVRSLTEREKLVNMLPLAQSRSAGDAYIFAVLCSFEQGSLRADPLHEAKQLESDWTSYSDTKQRDAQCKQLQAALQQQSECMGRPGFPYIWQETQQLRQALRNQQANLRNLLGQSSRDDAQQ